MIDEFDERSAHAPRKLPDHESGVRRLTADAKGQPYVALRSLAEAQALPDGAVVLEGDYGGQIYVVAPAARVCCSEPALEALLSDIDALEWADPDGARLYYERHVVGAPVTGGMGGGVFTQDVWVHPKLNTLPATIVDVLAGRRARIREAAG